MQHKLRQQKGSNIDISLHGMSFKYLTAINQLIINIPI